MMFHSPLLLFISLARSLHAFPFNAHCTHLFGPLDAADTRNAADLIPLPALNPQATQQISNGRLVLEIPAAARDIRYPILFHSGNAVIELYQTGPEGSPVQLSRAEQILYLWPLAKRVALHVIASCVDVSHGASGGWTRFSVAPPREEGRKFVLAVKRRGVHGATFAAMRSRGYQIWPEVEV